MASSSSSSQGSALVDAPAAVAPSRSRFPYLAPVTDVYTRFSQWRTALGLPNPGTVENLQKEVKSTHLTNYFFDGARADLTKALSMEPAFHVTHSFSLASQTAPSSYNFGAVFATNRLFLQGNVDHEGSLNGRFNHGWSENNVTKAQFQLPQQQSMQMLQLEHDYQGNDYSVNVKAINPSPVDLHGIYVGSYLQSLTKNLALGAETVWQHVPTVPFEESMGTSYIAKYTSTDKNWIATAMLQPMGIFQATYWQKLSPKVDVAADLQMIVAPGKREGVATLGAKYDLRMSTFRAQIDSLGRVSALLEQRFAPSFAFLVSGEIDHFKNAAKVGVGVMIESSTMTPEEMGMPPAGQSYPSTPYP